MRVLTIDPTVIFEDRLDILADKSEILGNAGVNIDGGCGFGFEGKDVIYVFFEDAPAARQALEEANLELTAESQVLLVEG